MAYHMSHEEQVKVARKVQAEQHSAEWKGEEEEAAKKKAAHDALEEAVAIGAAESEEDRQTRRRARSAEVNAAVNTARGIGDYDTANEALFSTPSVDSGAEIIWDASITSKREAVNQLKDQLQMATEKAKALDQQLKALQTEVTFSKRVAKLTGRKTPDMGAEIEDTKIQNRQRKRQIEMFRDGIDSQERRIELIKVETDFKDGHRDQVRCKWQEKAILVQQAHEKLEETRAQMNAKTEFTKQQNNEIIALQNAIYQWHDSKRKKAEEEQMMDVTKEAFEEWARMRKFWEMMITCKVQLASAGMEVQQVDLDALYMETLVQGVRPDAWKQFIVRALTKGLKDTVAMRSCDPAEADKLLKNAAKKVDIALEVGSYRAIDKDMYKATMANIG